jgi:hypothetical protein
MKLIGEKIEIKENKGEKEGKKRKDNKKPNRKMGKTIKI